MKRLITPLAAILFAIGIFSCKTSKHASLPVIRSLEELNSVPGKKALLQTPSGKKYIISKKHSTHPHPETGDTTSFENSLFEDIMLAFRESSLIGFSNRICDASGCPDSCEFDGVKRRSAKTTLSPGPVKKYSSVKKFLTEFADLHPDNEMHGIVGNSESRIELEDFNAKITSAWLFCFAKQSDEDFHLVVGHKKNVDDPDNRFMMIEISGLPHSEGNDRRVLSKVQKDFFELIGGPVCDGGYYWFDDGYDPVKITVSGSVYWDKEHWSQNNNASFSHGPNDLKTRMKTVWEIHPITSIREK